MNKGDKVIVTDKNLKTTYFVIKDNHSGLFIKEDLNTSILSYIACRFISRQNANLWLKRKGINPSNFITVECSYNNFQ